jgi:hypothetical protein
MKRKPLLTVVLAVVLAFNFTTRAFALFGIGDIVFDPSVYGEVVQQLIQMERQYLQLVQSYQMLRNQYDHLTRMAQQVPVEMRTRYRVVRTGWRRVSATDTYGTTGSWIAGINTGHGVPEGYAQATEPLSNYGPGISNIPAGQLERIKTQYGTVELADGANQSGIQTIGRLREHAPMVESVVRGLEDDSLSPDPRMNTEIAVLNKINAAHLVSIRAAQDANLLLTALAEQRVIEAKRVRDAEARAINNHIRFVSEARAVMTAQAARASRAMLDWRMP